MKKYFKFLTLAALVVSMSSCLKDKSTDNGTTGLVVDNQVFVQLGGASQAARFSSVALDFENKPVTPVFVIARLLSVSPAPVDIVITLDTLGQAAALLPAGVVKLPNSFYTLPAGGLTVTIPKGSNEGTLKINTNAIQFDPSTTYGLGFKIKSVSPSSYQSAANFSTFYTTVGAKNKYDGVYSMTFSNYHPSSNPGYTGEKTTVHMITTGGSTNKMFWPLASAFGIPSILGGGFSYFGAQEPAYTVDPVTNKVTIVNAAVGGSVVYAMAAGYDSRYEPSTRTYYIKFGYNNPGGVFNSATTREWTQEFTYTGPRP